MVRPGWTPTRIPARRLLGLTLSVLVSIALSGCEGHDGAPAARAVAVDGTTAPTIATSRAAGPPASVSTRCPLRFSAVGQNPEGNGYSEWLLTLTNLSDRPCTLRGYPHLGVVDPHGHVVRIVQAHRAASGSWASLPDTEVVLKAGGSASFPAGFSIFRPGQQRVCSDIASWTTLTASLPGLLHPLSFAIHGHRHSAFTPCPGDVVDVGPVQPGTSWPPRPSAGAAPSALRVVDGRTSKCTAAQIGLSFGSVGGTAGTEMAPVRLTNISSLPCRIGGYLSISRLSFTGGQVPTHVSHRGSFNGVFPDPGPHRFTLRPASVASAMVSWIDNPVTTLGGRALESCRVSYLLRIRLPGQRSSRMLRTGRLHGAQQANRIAACGGSLTLTAIQDRRDPAKR
jgi:hypothetical protein